MDRVTDAGPEPSPRPPAASVLISAAVTMAIAVLAPAATWAESSDEAGTEAPSAPQAPPDERSPNRALAYAAGGLGASLAILGLGIELDQGGLIAVGALGTLVAPSAGHFYSGDLGGAFKWMGIRGLGAGVGLLGLLLVATDDCGETGATECSDGASTLVIAAGAVVFAGATLYSIRDAPRSARRVNARRRDLTVTAAPVVGPDRSIGAGLQVGGSF